jgi:hypothetical protein
MSAMLAAEFPLVQPHLYDLQIPPISYQRAAAGASTTLFMILEGTLLAVALFMTFKAYTAR